MNKLIFGLGATVFGLLLTGDANAHETHGHAAPHATIRTGHVAARPYYLEHGVRFNGGYIYRGQDHHHWGYRVWNTRYNRYQYWDPTLRCYYYWNPAAVAYYPATEPETPETRRPPSPPARGAGSFSSGEPGFGQWL